MRFRLLILVLAAFVPCAAAVPQDKAQRPKSPVGASQAPIALLVDLSAGQTLFERNADQRFLPASMTKAMTALVALDLIAAGKLQERAVVTVSPRAARLAGVGTTLSLRSGQQVSVSDLLRGVTIASANDATVALAEGALGSEGAWLAAMNARAKALGMADSYFASANGLPDGGRTQVTARDMVRLARALFHDHPQLYRRYFEPKTMEWQGLRLASRNPINGVVAGADGIKTGHTREAGYTFLGAVERDGRRLVLVVARAPDEASRAKAARGLAEWGYAAWDSQPLVRAGQFVGTAQVQQGAAREVGLMPLRDWRVALPKGSIAPVSTRIVYRGPLVAPLAKGQVVAGLEVTIAGQPPHDIPLATTAAVNSAGAFDRLVNGLLGLLP